MSWFLGVALFIAAANVLRHIFANGAHAATENSRGLRDPKTGIPYGWEVPPPPADFLASLPKKRKRIKPRKT